MEKNSRPEVVELLRSDSVFHMYVMVMTKLLFKVAIIEMTKLPKITLWYY